MGRGTGRGVDLVLRGGVVLTGVPAGPRARAVAVHDGLVVAVDEDALGLAGDAVEVVDLAGGAVLPGFGDGHAHPLWGGLEQRGPQVGDATSVAEAVEAVRAYAAAHPDDEWLVGGGYDPTLSPGGRFDALWLDAAVPDRPVLLRSSDHHAAWVNTEAMRRAGIEAGTPDPATGSIARRDDGSPLGTLVEWAATEPVAALAPTPTRDDQVAALRHATAMFAAAGVTWVQEAAASPADVETYLAASRAGALSVRVDVALRADPGERPGRLAAFTGARDESRADPSVRVRTVKLFADGVVEAGTAAMLEPYDDAPHCGQPVWSPDELAAAAVAFDAAGFQLHVHAIGDAAVRHALDAVAHVRDVNGPADRRPVLAHVQVVDPADLPRFADLGVVANLEPLWAQLDPTMTELTLPRLGSRGRLQYPMASLVASGAVLSMGSDWPVSSHRPLDGLAVAVTRQTPDGDPAEGWLPDQRLPPATALSAYTAGSAYQSFEEHLRGTVGVGRRADLVWLAADPFDVPPADWPGLAVLGTWLGGQRVHGAGDGPWSPVTIA